MRWKRLQHAADTLCHMFCGWRLTNSFADLAQLGSGVLTVDATSAVCQFNGKPITSLMIAEKLRAWLHADLAANNIPLAGVQRAVLSAELLFADVTAGQRLTSDQHMDKAGQPIRSGVFHRVRIHCTSEVATDDAVYRSQ